MCHFPFLPTSCHTPPLHPGDARVFARDGGTLVIPTAHTCPGNIRLCGFRDPCLKGAQSWEGPWRPHTAFPQRPQRAIKGNAGESWREPAIPGAPSGGALKGICHIPLCASSSVCCAPVCVLKWERFRTLLSLS